VDEEIMKLDFLGDWKRTHTCGALRPEHAGQVVVMMGWVDRVRDLGSLIFVELRDREGVTQVVFNKDTNPQAHEHAMQLGREYVAAVKGQVVARSAANVNSKVSTGGIEVVADELRLLNDARTPPFNIDDQQAMTDEETRLRYRFLDLRRPRMQANIALRHKLAFELRSFMNEQGFYEIETPFLTRSTPEGARDYLVPSRIYPGSFYALPQSPQLFKQILMISGFDKYFQVVRCFRDEDFRADRQAEFTQIDIEMSYPQRETVWAVVEGMLTRIWKAGGVEISTPFPRMSYDDAMKAYGIDKPDLRLPPMVTVNECFGAEALEKLRLSPEHPVLAFRLPKCADLSRKEREELQKFLEDKGGRGFVDLRNKGGVLEGSLVKNYADAAQKVAQAVGAADGDLIVVAGAPHGLPVKKNDFSIYIAAGALRLSAGQKYHDRHHLLDPRDFRFLWVTDFPMFEWNPNEHRWEAAHHPFTSPHEHDMDKLESDPGAVRALAYDCVLNGTELGSGSIRIHRQDIQSVIFKALGFTEEQARRRFGFFLDALAYGTPPHGGIALGLDRIVMLLAGENSLREVIAFPKTARAQDLMTDAPTPVDEAQLRELGLSVLKKPKS
jgi:aspartyl-tRNA synthetase